jgi:hypothetical protein
MTYSFSGRALAALALGGLLLGSCGGNGASTNTPSSTLGTDSAATKVGGMPDSLNTGTPAGGSGGAMNSTAPGTSATGTSATGSATSNSPAGTAGTPTMGGTGASGSTNSTGAN